MSSWTRLKNEILFSNCGCSTPTASTCSLFLWQTWPSERPDFRAASVTSGKSLSWAWKIKQHRKVLLVVASSLQTTTTTFCNWLDHGPRVCSWWQPWWLAATTGSPRAVLNCCEAVYFFSNNKTAESRWTKRWGICSSFRVDDTNSCLLSHCQDKNFSKSKYCVIAGKYSHHHLASSFFSTVWTTAVLKAWQIFEPFCAINAIRSWGKN